MSNNRIIFLYCVTCLINNKYYIGQTVDCSSRWLGHRRDSANPKVPFHHAIKKYGAHNFKFEVIATCKGQDNANELETLLVSQYDSFITNGNGYNATHGGFNAPKSDEWKLALKKWRESLTPEERTEISKKQSEATIKQIAEKGHPGLGTKRTDEQKSNISKALKALDKDSIYTEEVRQTMSEAHIGLKDSEETKKKKSISIKENWQKRQEELLNSGELKCNAPKCNISGLNQKYLIVNNIRYCGKHGQRLKRNGSLEVIPMNERKLTIGKEPSNKKHFSEEQIKYIISVPKSICALSKEFGVTEKVIKRIRQENKTINQYL